MTGEPPRLQFEPLETFAATDEPGAEPLVRDPDGGAAIAEGSIFTMYGTGGAGKTTAMVDMNTAWGAGRSWLGLLTPARPLRIVVIENEGPRPMLRAKLRRKLAGFDGRLDGRITMMTEPWARFTFRDEAETAELAAHLASVNADLLVAGPVSRIGMEGGGTPDEIRDFMRLIEQVQAAAGGRVAVALLHHENRAGQVSGAWEAVPDTLAHVQALGHGRTRIYWQKARWSSSLHGTTTNLAWAPGDSFTIEARAEVTEATMADEILAAALEHPGGSWRTIRATVKGKTEVAQDVRDRLIGDGLLVNSAARSGKFSLWHHEDPAAPGSLAGTAREPLTVPPTGEGQVVGGSPVPAYKGTGNGTTTTAPVDEPAEPPEPPEPDDDRERVT